MGLVWVEKAHCRSFSTTNMWWQSTCQVAIRGTCPEPVMPVSFLSSVLLSASAQCLVLCSALCWINSTELPKTTGGQLKKQNIKQNSSVLRHLSSHSLSLLTPSIHLLLFLFRRDEDAPALSCSVIRLFVSPHLPSQPSTQWSSYWIMPVHCCLSTSRCLLHSQGALCHLFVCFHDSGK